MNQIYVLIYAEQHIGKPGPGTLVGPYGTLQKTENRDPSGTLQNRKTRSLA